MKKDDDAFNFDVHVLGDEDYDFGMWEGFCQACEVQENVNDLGLCQGCAGKLERDLIRRRDWEYTIAAYGTDAKGREVLRKEVIKNYGSDCELINVPQKSTKPKISS